MGAAEMDMPAFAGAVLAALLSLIAGLPRRSRD